MHYVYVCQKGQHAASSSSPADGEEEGVGASGVDEGDGGEESGAPVGGEEEG